jgi:hypothetical protein
MGSKNSKYCDTVNNIPVEDLTPKLIRCIFNAAIVNKNISSINNIIDHYINKLYNDSLFGWHWVDNYNPFIDLMLNGYEDQAILLCEYYSMRAFKSQEYKSSDDQIKKFVPIYKAMELHLKKLTKYFIDQYRDVHLKYNENISPFMIECLYTPLEIYKRACSYKFVYGASEIYNSFSSQISNYDLLYWPCFYNAPNIVTYFLKNLSVIDTHIFKDVDFGNTCLFHLIRNRMEEQFIEIIELIYHNNSIKNAQRFSYEGKLLKESVYNNLEKYIIVLLTNIQYSDAFLHDLHNETDNQSIKQLLPQGL